MKTVARSADARRLRTIAIVCVLALAIAVAFGVGKNLLAGAWFAGGAIAASLICAAAIWRLAGVAQEWRRELRSSKALFAKAESALTEALVHERMLMDSINDALFICDTNGNIVDANETARVLFDFENPIGRSLLAVTLSYELQQLAVLASHHRGLNQTELSLSYPRARVATATSWRPSGSERVYVTLQDETELRRLEKVRTDFVANVSHELRTPMATLRAMAETIHDDPHMPVVKLNRYTEKMISEVDRLTSISEDLLTLSAAESKPIEKELVDLSQVVRYCIHQLEGRASEQQIALSADLPDGLDMLGDKNQLIQVFTNLLSNALRYTQKGSICVSGRRHGDTVVVEVRDTGIGIASEHLPRIFERFYRVDRARSRETGGTGLGLSIVRHIVESHGGTVEVESELNAGSTFRTTFPAV